MPACARRFARIRKRFEVRHMRSRVVLIVALLLVSLSSSRTWAATATVRDGGTLQLGNVTYRLDGIDAPAFDQLCIDEHADSWTCGIEARDQLVKLIGGRQVRCDDLGADPTFKKRRLGVCKVEGETHQPQPVAGPPGLRPECRRLCNRAFQDRRGPRQGRSSGTVERLFRSAARVPPRQEGRHAARAPHAAPTATAKFARRYSPRIS